MTTSGAPNNDGKRLPGDGRCIFMRKLTSEERCRRGDGSRVLTWSEAGGLLQIWAGFGEVLGRDFGKHKS